MPLGIRLERKKGKTSQDWSLRRPPPPAKVWIPLVQGSTPLIRLVEVGSKVLVGQKIAEAVNFLSVSLHASVSGTVSAIDSFPNPIEDASSAVEITGDGLDQKIPSLGQERPGWQDLSHDEILKIFQDLGVVDMDESMTPLHVKARLFHPKTSLLVLNACESEPYLTSDYSLMMSQPMEVLKGAEILRRACRAETCVFALEDNQREAGELLKSKIYFLKWKHFHVLNFPDRYPYEDRRVLTPLVRKQLRKPDSEHPVLMFNLASAYAAYEAVAVQKPLYERVVAVSGECVVEPRNLWLRTGTSFQDAIKFCRGLLREPGRIVMGGPMKGTTQHRTDVPVIKGTRAILALPNELVKPDEIWPCIRCGRCVEACPVDISPAMITLAAENDFFDLSRNYGIERCIECGNCGYVCPSKRPMVALIRYAKSRQ